MTTPIVLAAAVVLGALGAWGTYRLLSRLELDHAERFALTLALFPALLGLAAFGGLLAGRPGPLLPAALCVVLGVIGWSASRRPHPPPPSPLRWRGGEDPGLAGELPLPAAAGRGSGGRGLLGLEAEEAPVVVGTVLFGAGTLGTMLLTPLSAGALRVGDWVAHWFLVLFYLGQPLPELRTFTNRVGDFGIISRTPLFNMEGGLLVGTLDPAQFWPFQLITPLLALSVAAAGVVWARSIGGRGTAQVMAPLLGLSPFLLQNGAYPWSKMVAAGLVLLFLLLIRAAALARHPTRARQTFVLGAWCAGLGYLAHQTTIFYVLPTLLWLAWRRPRPLFRRPVGWSLATWALGGLAGVLAFGPWQAWVLATYGLQAVLDANPASFGKDVSETLGDWLLKGGVAAVGTLVPLPALTALWRGSVPTADQVLRIQLALLTGALGLSGCWLLARAALTPALITPSSELTGLRRYAPMGPHIPTAQGERESGSPSPRRRGGWGMRFARPPWLALVVLGGFFGQVMLQPNWHDTGDAADSMTPIVVLALAYVAREARRLGSVARWMFFGLVLAELGGYLGLWIWWAFGSAWTRDVNAILGSRYGLDHIRNIWEPATPIGAALLIVGLGASAVLLWRALAQPVCRR